MFLWENVPALADRGGSSSSRGASGSSDNIDDDQASANFVYLIDSVRSLGYDCRVVKVSPQDVQVPQSRSRFYILGARLPQPQRARGGADQPLPSVDLGSFRRVVASLISSRKAMHNLDSFLLPDTHPHVERALQAARRKTPNAATKVGVKWPQLHQDGYTEAQRPWKTNWSGDLEELQGP